jgi:hypothetical protein
MEEATEEEPTEVVHGEAEEEDIRITMDVYGKLEKMISMKRPMRMKKRKTSSSEQ